MKSYIVVSLFAVAAIMMAPAASAYDAGKPVFLQQNPSPFVAGAMVWKNTEDSENAVLASPVALSSSGSIWTADNVNPTGVHYTDSIFTYNLSLDKASGTVSVAYGYFQGVKFHQLALKSAPVTSERRTVLAAVPTGSTPLDIGRAVISFHLKNADLPAGAIQALVISSSVPNSLYTHESLVGAQSASQATVPLPELPAAVLFVAGAGVIGSVLVLRSRKGGDAQ